MSEPTPTPALPPRGQQAVLTALAAAMARAVAKVVTPAVLLIVLVAGIWQGPSAALSAAIGGALAGLTPLITLVVMRRTAHGSPRDVMFASYGAFMLKMIVLLVALFALGELPWVHRMSLAVSTILVLVVTTSAEGWASYRMQSFTLD